MNTPKCQALERVEHFQMVMRAALERRDALRLSDELDESFYEALREAVIAAAATDAACYS